MFRTNIPRSKALRLLGQKGTIKTKASLCRLALDLGYLRSALKLLHYKVLDEGDEIAIEGKGRLDAYLGVLESTNMHGERPQSRRTRGHNLVRKDWIDLAHLNIKLLIERMCHVPNELGLENIVQW